MKTLIAVLLLVCAASAQAAEAVGRIFFTPAQREQLDTLRKQKAVASQVRDEPVPETVTYNGIIRRSDGQATVWVNNQQLTGAELRDKQALVGSISRDGQIVLQAQRAGSDAQLKLKVGQSATLLSGKVDESFSAQRAPAPPKEKPAPEPRPAAAEAAKPAPAGDAVRPPAAAAGEATAR